MFITCNAKINIGLEILNKRTDDYHNINTIFHKICLADELIIENSENFIFVFNSDMQIQQENNLAYKAALEFQRVFKLDKLPVKITITKHIPAGAGLAGGSSDAANVMRGLANFFNLPLNNDELIAAATALGSDIPFFLQDKTSAIGKSRGEILTPFQLRLPYYIVLIMPGIHISTAAAYKSLNRTYEPIATSDHSELIHTLIHQPEKLREYVKNDFEETAFKQEPQLATIKSELYDSGALFALMSGSGSTIYGFFNDEKSVKAAVEKFPTYRTHICKPDSF